MNASHAEHLHAILRAAQEAYERGDEEDALRRATSFLDHTVGAEDAHWLRHRGEAEMVLGVLYQHRDHATTAVEHFRRAVEAYTRVGTAERSDVEALRWARYRYGATLAQDQQWEASEAVMAELVAELLRDGAAPHDLRFQTIGAMVDFALHRDRTDEAREWLATLHDVTAPRTDAEHGQALDRLASIAAKDGDWESARASFVKAAEHYSASGDEQASRALALRNAAAIDRRFGRLQRALTQLTDAIAGLRPDTVPRVRAMLFHERTKANSSSRRAREALADAKTVVDILTSIQAPASELADAYLTWGIAANEAGEPADPAWDRAAELYSAGAGDVSDLVLLLANRATLAMQGGDLVGAAARLREAVGAAGPDGAVSADAQIALANAVGAFLYVSGEFDGAIDALTDALTIRDDRDPRMHRNVSAAELAKARALGLNGPAGRKHARRALVSAVQAALQVEMGAFQFTTAEARAAFRSSRVADRDDHLAWAVFCATSAGDPTTVADLIWMGRVAGRAAVPAPSEGLSRATSPLERREDARVESSPSGVFAGVRRALDAAHTEDAPNVAASVGRESAGRLVAPSGRELLSPWRQLADADAPRVRIR